MRYPTHIANIQTAISSSIELVNQVLDLSGSTFSTDALEYNYITTRELHITSPSSCTLGSSIRVINTKASTAMKRIDEIFSYDSAIIYDLLPSRDLSGSIYSIYNKRIEFTNPRINIPGSIISSASGLINTEGSVNSVTTQILSITPGSSYWIFTVNSTSNLYNNMDIRISGLIGGDTNETLTAKIINIVSSDTLWVIYSGPDAQNPPDGEEPQITSESNLLQETITLTNASITLDDLRIQIPGQYATPDISGACMPSIVAGSDDTLYISFISKYTNTIGYTDTLFDILVGHISPSGTSWSVDWIHRIDDLVTTKEESTPILAIDATTNELYIAYMTNGATSGNMNANDIFSNGGSYGICGCPNPESCSACGLEDIVLAKINVSGASSTTQPTVVWKVQNGYINSIYRETKPSISIDPVNRLVYLAYECNRNLACFAPVGSTNILLHCFTTQGNHLWVQAERLINSSGANTLPCVSADSKGNVYLTYEITAQVDGGADVPIGQKQIEVVRFQTQLSTPNTSNIYNSALIYIYGSWVYYPPTNSWYQARDLNVQNVVPTDRSKWSEPYSANLMYSRRVWVLSQAINIFATDGLAGEECTQPTVCADPSNGMIFLSFLTTGSVRGLTRTAVHDLVVVGFTNDLTLKWIHQGGGEFNPSIISYIDCDSPYMILDQKGNLQISLLTYLITGEMNMAVFGYDQTGHTHWSYTDYPVYMYGRTDAPQSVFDTSPPGSFSKIGIGRGPSLLFFATITDIVAPGETQVGTSGITNILCVSVFREEIYYNEKSAFSYIIENRSICACSTGNCGC